jgi:voltage-gated potassium channel
LSPIRRAAAGASRAVDAFARNRYRILFVTLLVTLGVDPLSEALGLDWRLLGLLVAINLVVAAAGISRRLFHRYLLVAVALLSVVIRALPEESLPVWLITVGGLLWIGIAMVATIGAVRFALRSTVVDLEHVAAALSAYLLAGLLFAVLYVLVDYRWPGSVVELAGGTVGPLTLKNAIYYSFVTLATLGYGDVVPRGVARGLAVVEAVGAQLYLTVTVARLVGLHAHAISRQPPPADGDQ